MVETPPEELYSQPLRRRGQPAGRPRYGKVHRQLRAWWALRVAAGGVPCCAALCLFPSREIRPGEPFHLGHNDEGTGYRGPEHVNCSVTDGARRARRDTPRPWKTTRDW